LLQCNPISQNNPCLTTFNNSAPSLSHADKDSNGQHSIPSIALSSLVKRIWKPDSEEGQTREKPSLTMSSLNSFRDLERGILSEHYLARNGNLAELKESLTRDPELLHAKDDLGNTLLHYAAMGVSGGVKSNADVVSYLLELDPNMQFVQSCDGKTPFHVAIDRGLSGRDLVRVFIERLQDKENELTRRTKNGRTVLHYAARNDCLESVVMLASCLSSKLSHSLHLQDANGCTPLHYAGKLVFPSSPFGEERVTVTNSYQFSARNDNFGLIGGPTQQSQVRLLLYFDE
jgi:ankyrin repeat protein